MRFVGWLTACAGRWRNLASVTGFDASRAMSLDVLEVRPRALQIRAHAATQEDRAILFVGHRVGHAEGRGDRDIGAALPVAGEFATHADDDAAVVLARSPQPVLVVAAQRARKAVVRAVEVDRTGLAVVVRDDRGPGALVGR